MPHDWNTIFLCACFKVILNGRHDFRSLFFQFLLLFFIQPVLLSQFWYDFYICLYTFALAGPSSSSSTHALRGQFNSILLQGLLYCCNCSHTISFASILTGPRLWLLRYRPIGHGTIVQCCCVLSFSFFSQNLGSMSYDFSKFIYSWISKCPSFNWTPWTSTCISTSLGERCLEMHIQPSPLSSFIDQSLSLPSIFLFWSIKFQFNVIKCSWFSFFSIHFQFQPRFLFFLYLLFLNSLHIAFSTTSFIKFFWRWTLHGILVTIFWIFRHAAGMLRWATSPRRFSTYFYARNFHRFNYVFIFVRPLGSSCKFQCCFVDESNKYHHQTILGSSSFQKRVWSSQQTIYPFLRINSLAIFAWTSTDSPSFKQWTSPFMFLAASHSDPLWLQCASRAFVLVTKPWRYRSSMHRLWQ